MMLWIKHQAEHLGLYLLAEDALHLRKSTILTSLLIIFEAFTESFSDPAKIANTRWIQSYLPPNVSLSFRSFFTIHSLPLFSSPISIGVSPFASFSFLLLFFFCQHDLKLALRGVLQILSLLLSEWNGIINKRFVLVCISITAQTEMFKVNNYYLIDEIDESRIENNNGFW